MKDKKEDRVKKTKSLNVLVADDDEGMCKMFTKWLSVEGHKVKTASTGEKALQQVKKEQFDVVFLDIVMSGIPAIDVLEEIKGTSPKTKVIMITGKLLDKDSWKDLKQKGATGYLLKPFKLEDITECLAAL